MDLIPVFARRQIFGHYIESDLNYCIYTLLIVNSKIHSALAWQNHHIRVRVGSNPNPNNPNGCSKRQVINQLDY